VTDRFPSFPTTTMATATSDQVIDILARVSDTEEVRTNPDLALYDLQILDSMKTVELIVALQQEVGVEISPAEFDRDAWATPAKMVADVQKRLAA
jgi:D-alanine--poly(phosphoribitol) ligase subunit 2